MACLHVSTFMHGKTITEEHHSCEIDNSRPYIFGSNKNSDKDRQHSAVHICSRLHCNSVCASSILSRVFSERELTVVVRLSVVCRLSSVTFVHPTQAVEIFGNASTPFGTLAI